MIKVRNLVKKYGDFIAVNGVSFDVEDGEVFAFLGPNGAGKSTTIKMLTTILHPTSGSVMLNGIDPVKDPEQARRSFGIVFQDPSVDEDLTAWENLDLHGVLYDVPEKERRQRSEELLKFVDLWGRKDSLVKEFSGGMKRRLEIARAFLHEPKIIFLDEPTIGLDPQTRNLMWERIHELNKTKGTTIFFSTHLMEEADKWANRISIMDHGKILTTGSAADLKQQTNTQYLEDAFLALTGKDIREQGAEASNAMKAFRGGGRR